MKLVEAMREAVEFVKCEHDWQADGLFCGPKMFGTIYRCPKCGARITRPATDQDTPAPGQASDPASVPEDGRE